jgi:hypothetical protein
VFHIFGGLVEFERNLIRERRHAKLAATQARGRKGGRPKRLNSQQRSLSSNWPSMLQVPDSVKVGRMSSSEMKTAEKKWSDFKTKKVMQIDLDASSPKPLSSSSHA